MRGWARRAAGVAQWFLLGLIAIGVVVLCVTTSQDREAAAVTQMQEDVRLVAEVVEAQYAVDHVYPSSVTVDRGRNLITLDGVTSPARLGRGTQAAGQRWAYASTTEGYILTVINARFPPYRVVTYDSTRCGDDCARAWSPPPQRWPVESQVILYLVSLNSMICFTATGFAGHRFPALRRGTAMRRVLRQVRLVLHGVGVAVTLALPPLTGFTGAPVLAWVSATLVIVSLCVYRLRPLRLSERRLAARGKRAKPLSGQDRTRWPHAWLCGAGYVVMFWYIGTVLVAP